MSFLDFIYSEKRSDRVCSWCRKEASHETGFLHCVHPKGIVFGVEVARTVHCSSLDQTIPIPRRYEDLETLLNRSSFCSTKCLKEFIEKNEGKEQ